VGGQTLDALFDRMFSDRTDEERAEIKKRYANDMAVAGAPKRIEAICLDLLDHFTKYIAPNGFKAQVVAVSRDVAATYKETLDRLNGPPSELIMSASNDDTERLARYARSKDETKRLIERFKDPKDPLAILIVCDMLITGFDAPVEQVMYLDSPLREHTLLQAIARVNRTADHKTYGLVVDYWGVSTALQEALAIFAPGDVLGAMEPKSDELPRLQARHAAVLNFFAKVKDKDDLDACVSVLEPEDVRAAFDSAFRRFSQSLDMLLPDPRALPYVADLRWLGKVRQAARARFRDASLDLADCGAKVRKLIEEAISVEGIQVLVKEVSLFSRDFEEKVAKLGTPEARASEMEHAIKHEIHVHIEENPAFYESLRERLEKIIEDRKAERIEAAKQLELLQVLVDEVRNEAKAGQDVGLSPTAFAIYGILEDRPTVVRDSGEEKPRLDEPRKALAGLIEEALEPYVTLVDFQAKDSIQREMRAKVKRQLRAARIDEERIEDLALRIVSLAKARRAK
jgi:type I restriction enzyme R subunit